jgi:hypothetical protein
MAHMALRFTTSYLTDSLDLFRYYKNLAERAMAQVSDEQLFAVLDHEANSIAVIVKHMAGNMRSRWTDFLTSDGEKPDRFRDREFEIDANTTRSDVMRYWEEGWSIVFATLESLKPEDVSKTVTIRQEPHTVLQALNRALAHYAQHIGQIVFLSKHLRSSEWQTLSIPRGKSEEYNLAPPAKHSRGTYKP